MKNSKLYRAEFFVKIKHTKRKKKNQNYFTCHKKIKYIFETPK